MVQDREAHHIQAHVSQGDADHVLGVDGGVEGNQVNFWEVVWD